jgi:hypothetical protein
VAKVDLCPVVVAFFDQVDEPEGVVRGGDRAAVLRLNRDVAEPVTAESFAGRTGGTRLLASPADGWDGVIWRSARDRQLGQKPNLVSALVPDVPSLPFDRSGPVVVPGALVPVQCGVEHGYAVYLEPAVWLHDRL